MNPFIQSIARKLVRAVPRIQSASQQFLRSWLLFLSLLAPGCGGAAVQVVEQASPNPLLGLTTVAMAPIRYVDPLMGGRTEADFLAEKNEEDQAQYVNAKVALEAEFLARFRARAQRVGMQVQPGAASGAAFVVHPEVTFIEPGFYPRRAQMRLTLKVTTARGDLVDEVTFRVSTGFGLGTRVASRLIAMGAELGTHAGKYLAVRSQRQ